MKTRQERLYYTTRDSVNMKTLLVLNIFILILACAKCQPDGENEIPHLISKYCALPVESRENYRFCTRENKVGEHLQFARNCAQQIRYYPTFHELEKFVCHTRTEHEYLHFLKCYVPALNTLNVDDKKTLPIIRKCLAIAAVHGLKTLKTTGQHIIPHDITYF